MVAAVIVALTGGTGFVGSRLLDLLTAKGIQVQALARSPQQPREAVEWVPGSLSDAGSVDALVAGADAVIHVAGVINARSNAEFELGNVAGTQAVAEAARAAGVRRFVHVSSLAAKLPSLSRYGASKAKAEDVVAASRLDWTIVRPPAVYGPGDRETLELFRMARLGLVLTPAKGRLSLIHADDLAELLSILASEGSGCDVLEPDDGRSGGWTHREFAAALSRAVQRRTLTMGIPRAVMRGGAVLDRLLRGDRAKLTADRIAYFCHPDWLSDPSRAVPAALWRPTIETAQGLADTAAWYRAQGWL